MNRASKFKNAILYAEALYKGAQEKQQTEELYAAVADSGAELVQGIEEFKYLNSPLLKQSEKEELLNTLGTKLHLCSSLVNLLKLLADNRKMDELPLILQHFKAICNEKNNIAEVEVETVEPLTAEQDSRLKEKLALLFKKNIMINYRITPQIIGGLKIKYGTFLIDSSVQHKLNCMEQLMKGTK